ncbi:SDR family NAD(P)-dependent oxidoreductase [Cohnella ginsengisoli]|uniref:SDR family NAD(P)-dependent oxidoreductase n=1 Tax=Cohnella ginsengisoli TaxID=425004 RepID=A0A9X4KHZ0_9BACL|nr:SDR family NAD(P)-dependent oxidoreductase [Cohnella ginsengisoli]MDG0792325.1 SDR family NAD(P)-dependent oxidoreductase [Cohnella ginsengisoli]
MKSLGENVKKLAVVTASYSGIGSEISKQLAREGYDLIFIGRDRGRMEKQCQALRTLAPASSIRAVAADLSDHGQIREAARQVSEISSKIDLLIHNAGILLDGVRLSPQKQDLHYEVNTFAPYLLTELLRPRLRAAGRSVVVLVGSSAMKMARKLELADLPSPRRFKKFKPYAQSKLAGAAAFFAMADDYEKDGIALRVADPGMNRTAMSKNPGVPGLFRMLSFLFQTPDGGARRIVDAATNPGFGARGGIYIEKGRIARTPPPVTDHAVQRELLDLLSKHR